MEKIRKMLFWCAVLGFAVQLIWMAMIIFAGETIYSFHSNLWHLEQYFSKDKFYSYNLVGIGMWKMAVMFFFALPWAGMKIVES